MACTPGNDNNFRRTIRAVTLYVRMGANERKSPRFRIFGPELLHITEDGFIIRGIELNTEGGRIREHEQMWLVAPLLERGKSVVIPSRATSKHPREHDRHLYKARHLVENFFARLKHYRAIATRYDKTARNFSGAIHLVACMAWLA